MDTGSLARPLKLAAIGAKVKKQFHSETEGGLAWFNGTVTKYDARRQLYWITYEDDDQEEMAWAEVKKHLQQLPSGNAVAHDSADQQRQAKQQVVAAKASGSSRSSLDAPPPAERQDQGRPQPAAAGAAAAAMRKAKVKAGQPEKQQQEKQQKQQQVADKPAGGVSRSGSCAPDAAGPTAAAAAAAAAPPKTGRVRLLGRKTCSGAAPRPAAAAAAAAAPSKPKRPAAAADAAGSKKPRTAAAAADAAAGGKKRKLQQGQGAAAAQDTAAAAAASAAAAGQQPAKQPRPAAKRKRNGAAAGGADPAAGGAAAAAPSSKSAVDPIDELTFEPARVLARAHFAALAAFLQRVQAQAAAGPAAAAAAGAAAGEVVLAKGKGKQQVPLWAVQDEAVKVHKSDVLKALQANAVDFERGKEPWRRFAAAAAAVAGSSGSSSTNGSATADAAAAAAAALAGCVLFVADQPFADADAALANAVKAARGEFQRENRLAYVTEAERVRQRRAEREAHLAAAANNAAVNGQQEAHLAAAANNAADNNQQEAGTAAAAAIQKNPSARPDRVAESLILQSGRAVNRWGKHKDTRDSFGHLPGIPINHTFGLRSEALVLGAHKSPMAGIACAKLPPLEVGGKVYRKVPAATSIVMSGCYEDDHDAASDIVKYTGEGGNDLLGNKKQVKDQVLERGNRALLANIALGLPVRLFRRNDDRGSATSSVLFYDGLYDVVSWVKTRGKEGKVVYIYGLRRRAGQAASLSKPIERFKGVGTAKRAGEHVQNREHLLCTDVSKGREATPIVAVNEVNRELPPGLSLEEDVKWIVDDKKATDGPLLPSSQGSFRYITENEYEEGVDPPRPPVVVEEGSAEAVAAMAAELAAEAAEGADAAEAAGDGAAAAAADAAAQVQAAAAAMEGAAAAAGTDSMLAEDVTQQQQDEQQQQGGSRQLRERSAAAAPSAGAIAAGAVSIDPSGTGGRPVGCQCWFTKDIVVKKPGEAPHELLKRLNYGHLPYESRVQAGSDKGPQLPMSRDICPVIFECGDWTGCTDPACDQRQAQRGVQYKLELFMTAGKGWGVRSWQAIKAGSLVCVMHGRITRAEAVGDEGSGYESSSYFFDMTPRTWRSLLTEGVEPVPQLARRCAQEQRGNREWSARYVLCAREQGGVARFINHSCEPNLYVQPLCVGHTDMDMVAIGLFALENIPKFTELSYDYGSSYIEENLGGVCLCGTDACKYKPQQTPEQLQEQVQQQQ